MLNPVFLMFFKHLICPLEPELSYLVDSYRFYYPTHLRISLISLTPFRRFFVESNST